MWNFFTFGTHIVHNWVAIAQAKPSNYPKKFRGIYKTVNKLSFLSMDFKPSLKEEQEANALYAWMFYQMGAKNTLGNLVLGPETIRQRGDILANFGISAVKAYKGTVVNQKKFRSEDLASTEVGGVLSEANWWPLFNDAWILGGAHCLLRFYLHTPVSYSGFVKDDTIWDESESRPRVLGRELIALYTFGYRRIAHDKEKALGLVFAPCDRDTALNGTIKQICDAVDDYDSAASIKEILDDSVDYDSYDYARINVNVPVKFKVLETIVGYDPSLVESTQVRYEIHNGTLLVSQKLHGKFYEVSTDSTITAKMTGHPTQTQSSVKMRLMVHKDIFEGSLVQRLYY